MIRSVLALRAVEPGFDENNVLAAHIALSRLNYNTPEKRQAFFAQLLERVRALPGVVNAAATVSLPLSGQDGRTGIGIEGRAPVPGEPTRAHFRSVTPGYLETMRIPLRKGRLMTAQDSSTAPLVAWINEEAAKRYWPGVDPIGRRLRMGGTEEWRVIAGVFGNVQHWGLDRSVNPEVYLPHPQLPFGFMNVVVRTSGDPLSVAGAVRAAVQSIDKNQAVGNIQTMEEWLARSIATRRFYMILLGLFAGLALLLAAGGIFSVMSYAVNERTREIGLRMALGASAADVVKMVLRQGMTQVLVGVLLGLAGSFAATRLLEKLLFSVKSTDAITFVAVAVILTIVALLANWLPARRATEVDPMVALRHE
jgi:putative ABC transport system permease protein